MKINIEDFEREFDKDSVYLLEQKVLEEEQFWKWYNTMHRKPAQVVVINESKLKESHEQTLNPEVLPF